MTDYDDVEMLKSFITELNASEKELLLQKLKSENVYANASQREAKQSFFRQKSIISNAEPGELRDVEDEIYDFLDNFTTFQSNYKELSPQ